MIIKNSNKKPGIYSRFIAYLFILIIIVILVIAGLVLPELFCTNYELFVELLIQFLTLIAGIGGAYLIYRRMRATEEQVELSERGLRDERYNKAIENLGSDKESVLLGAVYGLYHSAKDFLASKKDKQRRKEICHLLCARVRELTNEEKYKRRYKKDPSEEIKTILNLLIEYQGKKNKVPFESWWIDLRGAHLEGAKLGGANLEGAKLIGVHLEGASLVLANLKGAELIVAQLKGADLFKANLEGANLAEANLEGSSLEGTYLEGANLSRAHLEEADLEGVDLEGTRLEGANLFEAHLEGARLRGVHLEGANLMLAHLEGAKLIGAHLEGANLEEANLEGANLEEAHLEGANLNYTLLLKSKINKADFSGAIAVSDKKFSPSRDRIESRIDKNTELETCVFAGYPEERCLDRYRRYIKKEEYIKRRKETIKSAVKNFEGIKSKGIKAIYEDRFPEFERGMEEVLKIIDNNAEAKISYEPPKGIKKDILKKEKADEIIKTIEEAEKKVTEIKKRIREKRLEN